ncbi:MAG TPA: hypothetical protein DHU71_02165, partial [Erythrobacter sp.]|nr:hypothetical protein [Erythrobacter sp.]
MSWPVRSTTRSKAATSGPSAAMSMPPIPTGFSTKPTKADAPLDPGGGMMRYLLVIAVTLALSACVRVVPDMRPQTPVAMPPGTVSSAAFAPVSRGLKVTELGIGADDAGTALVSFLESCPAILRREDQSGLTFADDWRPACEAAATWPVSDARRFFASYFETARVGDGAAFATGYYEPEIRGSRTRAPGYDVPVYAMPPELVRAWPD